MLFSILVKKPVLSVCNRTEHLRDIGQGYPCCLSTILHFMHKGHSVAFSSNTNIISWSEEIISIVRHSCKDIPTY